jgi:hypothetical protein
MLCSSGHNDGLNNDHPRASDRGFRDDDNQYYDGRHHDNVNYHRVIVGFL